MANDLERRLRNVQHYGRAAMPLRELCGGAADEIERLKRLAVDRQYMIDALVWMLGPVALKVWEGWQKRGVKRVHHSWGPKAYEMTGEERAQAILDFEAAPRRKIENVDAELYSEKTDVETLTPNT